MSTVPSAPAAVRNRDAILQVIRTELYGKQQVFEIGSGTGQHAIHFAAALPELTWQTSDLADNHPAIHHWISESGLANVLEPKFLDVSEAGETAERYTAVFSANTSHIMNKSSVMDMVAYVSRSLLPNGKFLLYGPFRVGGRFNGDSNARFDQSLRAQDPSMGIRDLEWIDDMAMLKGLVQQRTYAMPANNLLVVWMRDEGEGNDTA